MAAKKQKDKRDDISELSFEESIKELTNIVGKIEQGQIPLQDSLEQYEKGMALIKQCRTILEKAEKRIEKISEQELKPEETNE
jgi:exodeoxyribonuclease VII small subunit